MKNTILLAGMLLAMVGCSKSNDNHNSTTTVGPSFSNAFGGVTLANNGLFTGSLIGMKDYSASLSATGGMIISGGSYPYPGIGNFQLLVNGIEQQENNAPTGWYYNLNISEYGTPNIIIGTGALGVFNAVDGRKFWQLTISSDTAESGVYIDSI